MAPGGALGNPTPTAKRVVRRVIIRKKRVNNAGSSDARSNAGAGSEASLGGTSGYPTGVQGTGAAIDSLNRFDSGKAGSANGYNSVLAGGSKDIYRVDSGGLNNN